MTKQTWIFVGIFSALAAIGIVSMTAWRQGRELAEAKLQLQDALKADEARRANLDALQTEIEQKKEQIEELEKARDAIAQTHKQMESEMRAALESKDVTISELQGNLTVNILDRILFDSGEAVLKEEGQAVLQKIAAILSDYPTRQIQVIGHTDNIPIRAGSRGLYPSNWELSAARATAAIRFLQEKGGVDPRRLAAVGYGEHHPIADNATAEGRARNRRIALVVLPERIAFSDVTATNALPALDQAATNVPPAVDKPITNTSNTLPALDQEASPEPEKSEAPLQPAPEPATP